jgi:uncharacterized protein
MRALVLLCVLAAASAHGGNRKKHKALDNSIKSLDQSCHQAFALPACVVLGSYYENGSGVPKDEMKAAALYDKACKGKNPEGCSALARMSKSGKGGPVDQQRGAELHQQACQQGSSKGCVDLGRAHLEGQGVKKDAKKANEFFSIACDARDPLGCYFLGSSYENGLGVKKDEKRAAELYQQAVDGGEALGFLGLGQLLLTGRGVPRDEAAALRLLTRGCESGQPRSCRMVGDASADPVRAAGFWDTACRGGDAVGCYALGLAARDGKGVEKDEKRASELIGRACKRGFKKACEDAEK